MDIHSLFFMLCLICSTIQWSSCAEIFNIVTSSNSSCDGDLTCHTLAEYATSLSSNLSDNITLELQPGIHDLNSSLMLRRNIHFFTIRAANTTAAVLCSPGSSAYFSFSNQQQITVSDVTFINCRMELCPSSVIILVGLLLLLQQK